MLYFKFYMVLYSAQCRRQHCKLQSFDSLEHCISRTTITNSRFDRDSSSWFPKVKSVTAAKPDEPPSSGSGV